MSLNELEPIDALRAVELLEKAVAERGEEWVYQRVHDPLYDFCGDGVCLYVNEGQPSCLVGMALVLHGVPVQRLEEINRVGAGALHDHFAEVVAASAAEVFREAQTAQDSGATWGDALSAARSRAADFGVSV
jgi:hypothetical protein